MSVGGQDHAPVDLPPGKKSVIHLTEGRDRFHGRSGRVQKSPAPTSIWSPDRPAITQMNIGINIICKLFSSSVPQA